MSYIDYEKIVIISGIIDESIKVEIIGKMRRFLPNSADIFQKNLIDGLIDNGVNCLSLVNSIQIGSFPKYYSDIYIKGRTGTYGRNCVGLVDTSFINLPVVQKKSRYFSLKKAVKSRFRFDEKILFVFYSLLPHNASLIRYIKKYYKCSKNLLIITDLPQYMTLQENSRVSLLGTYHKIDNWMNEKNLHSALGDTDYFVILSEYMREVIPKGKKIMLMEGIIDTELYDRVKPLNADLTKVKKIVYTGALEENLGVTDLVEAFEKLGRNDCHLIIAGDGNLNNYVTEKTKQNSCITFMGVLAKEDAVRLQKSADILVCPTRGDLGCARYAFPAKLLEYLYTGNTVVANRLECIPQDYHKFIIFNDSGDVIGLRDAIIKGLFSSTICTSEQKEWIKDNKSKEGQARRILEFVHQ